ncbi:hypothetical protein BTVI_58208 [Pitangus sulphuratus]|nr:hypothetical protein BTVI_58208 [Pitangus sulphuratus]
MVDSMRDPYHSADPYGAKGTLGHWGTKRNPGALVDLQGLKESRVQCAMQCLMEPKEPEIVGVGSGSADPLVKDIEVEDIDLDVLVSSASKGSYFFLLPRLNYSLSLFG